MAERSKPQQSCGRGHGLRMHAGCAGHGCFGTQGAAGIQPSCSGGRQEGPPRYLTYRACRSCLGRSATDD